VGFLKVFQEVRRKEKTTVRVEGEFDFEWLYPTRQKMEEKSSDLHP
jgi:hypothetical protein